MTDRPTPAAALQAVRAAGGRVPDALARVLEADVVPHDEWGGDDLNGPCRRDVALLLVGGVLEADVPFVRYLLEREVIAADAEAETLNVRRVLCYLIAQSGHVEDALLVWEAKTSSAEGFTGIDTRLVVGAGLAETLAFLDAEESEDAADAAEHVRERHALGELDGLGAFLSLPPETVRSWAD